MPIIFNLESFSSSGLVELQLVFASSSTARKWSPGLPWQGEIKQWEL